MKLFMVVTSILVIFHKSNSIHFVVYRTADGNKLVKRDVKDNSPPTIREFLVKINVANRYAETNITNKVENADTVAKQMKFSVVLPKRAFVSGFFMEIGKEIYKAFVMDKEEAKKIYTQSIISGQTAAHVAVSTRNSNRFMISINVEPETKVTFHLSYEELLRRIDGKYEVIVNIQPGQLVKKLQVLVYIRENSPLLFVRTPYLRSGTDLLLENSNLDPQAQIIKRNNSAVVQFYPDILRQLEFACAGLGNTENDGFAGQFVVEYDIERNSAGETIIQDDFCLNFFAPPNLEPLPKHIVFVLDTSGSMDGLKLSQLKESMLKILPQLYNDDLFDIVEYSDFIRVWDLNLSYHNILDKIPAAEYGNLAKHLENVILPESHSATEENIEKAKEIVNSLQANSLTNIIGGLEVGLYLIKRTQVKYIDQYQPILVFLTDGLPNSGISDTEDIIKKISAINKMDYNTPIYSLSFGEDADWSFLRTLSVQNGAEPIRFYVAEDIIIQFQNLYKLIGTPAMKNITFNNLPCASNTTQINFAVFYNGTELVVAGKGRSSNNTQPVSISGKGKQGPLEMEATLGIPLTKLERVWAYLSVKQLMDQIYAGGDKLVLEKLALDISLKYSLVTEVTSLVVVKPNSTDNTVELVDALDGILPVSPDELPKCHNITEWMDENDIDIIPEEPTTEMDPILEAIFGVNDTTENIATVTEQIITTTERIETCHDSEFKCCPDGVSYAAGLNYSGCDPVPQSESCSLPFDHGPCQNIAKKWYFDNKKATCRSFIYGGCEGNDNRFKTKEICDKTCVYATGLERCKLPISFGLRRYSTPRWFYNKTSGECMKYMYHGLFGNSNRFLKKLDCLDLCNPSKHAEVLKDRCFQPHDKGSGHCSNYVGYYYYDQAAGTCRKFWYNGCGGNDNRFKTKIECEQGCIIASKTYICQANPIRGTCRESLKKWYYDKATKTCKVFFYSGCGGNRNRFSNEKECMSICSQ